MAKALCSIDTPGGGVNVDGTLQFPGGTVSAGAAPGGSLAQKFAAALDAAIHGGGPQISTDQNGFNAGGKIIQFPLVNPYRPLKAVRSPISGLNAFPKVSDIVNFGYQIDRTQTFNNRGIDTNDQLPEGSESLGFMTPQEYPNGISLPSSGPSNLQLILDTIARTLPATISAAKKQPYYDPSAGAYGQPGQLGYGQPGYAGSQIGSQVGGAVGNVGDTLGNIVAQHPYLVLAGGAALVLLFMSPPRRR